MNLQEYLNNLENKAEVKEINLAKIQQEREQAGTSELLQGGELDLRSFKLLEKVEIDPSFLTTPLTKLNVDGLIHLKELDWLETKPESEEDKKFFEELGIGQEFSKKRVVKEIQRLAGLKVAKINFKEQEEGSIFLPLEQNDKAGNFCSSLVFWNFTYELAIMEIGGGEKDKTPEFWKHFTEQQLWVKDNLTEEYQKEFELLLNPSTFPTDKLEISELLSIYYPNAENIADSQESKATIDQEIIDKSWASIQKELLELTDQELKTSPDEEKQKDLAFKILIECSADSVSSRHYTLQISYHSNNPFKTQIEQLITTTPLQLENELLKEEKEQLPTTENFIKVGKQVQVLEDYLKNLISEEEYQQIKDKIDQIK